MSDMDGGRWSVERVNAWYDSRPWLVGCNFIPSNAVNQLEMWQAGTFDPVTIDRELDWAAGLGFNVVRVYLHDLAYAADPDGLMGRVDQFLAIAGRHGIKVMLVFFDDCWLTEAEAGKQPEPLPGIHNSGWLESPGLPQLERYSTDPGPRRRLEGYVKALLTGFRDDPRVLAWDLYNEPGGAWHVRGRDGQPFKRGMVGELCLPLLRDVYRWARQIDPSQPLTSCWFFGEHEFEAATQWADVLTFHHYSGVDDLERAIQRLAAAAPGRPMICTEYLARARGSRFQTHLPVFRRHRVGAVNWGLVAGKTMTIYDWVSWQGPGGAQEPGVWHHDIFRRDGAPFDAGEAIFIRSMT